MSFKILFSQMRALTAANLKTRYRGTFSGFLWVVMSPILIFGAQSYAFKLILNISVDNYLLFLLSGLLPWIFLVQSLEMCTPLFVNSGRFLKSFPIQPIALLGAQIVDNLFNFAVAFSVIFVFIAPYSKINYLNLVVLPLPLIIYSVAVISMAWLMASLNVFFRDLKFMIGFVLTFIFYLTPIFYPEKFVSERLHFLVNYNFIYWLVKPVREAVIGNPFTSDFLLMCAKQALIALIFLMAAVIFWRKKRNALYFSV